MKLLNFTHIPTHTWAHLLDEVYMARVHPNVQSITNKSKWEFYAGGYGNDAKWVQGDVRAAVPLFSWQNHTGVVTMTYFSAIKKYILTK